MNHSKDMDRIDDQDFLRSISSEYAADQVRCLLAVWLILGPAYLLIGVCFWRGWMTPFDWVMQSVWTLGMLVLCPMLLLFFAWGSKHLGKWPRCPVCGNPICTLLPALVTKRCPHCHSQIIADQRKGIPITPCLQMRDFLSKRTAIPSLPIDYESIKKVRILLPLPFLILTLILLKEETMEPDVIMAFIVAFMGFVVISIFGVTPMIPIAFLMRICRLMKLTPENQVCCPECGQIPSTHIVRMSGCCSQCGAKLLDLLSEPDNPKMMEWHALKQYYAWNFRGIVVLNLLLVLSLILFFLFHSVSLWMIFVGQTTVFLLFHVLNARMGQQIGLSKNCPHCAFPIKQAVRELLAYGRCPNCSHKLIRDGNHASEYSTEDHED